MVDWARCEQRGICYGCKEVERKDHVQRRTASSVTDKLLSPIYYYYACISFIQRRSNGRNIL
jgi:hypothetical protein